MQTKLRWDPRVLEPVFKDIYSMAQEGKKDFIPDFYDIVTSTKDMESYEGVGSGTTFEEWGHSNNQVFYSDVDEMWPVVMKNRKFSGGRQIERDFIDDLKITKIKDLITSLSDDEYRTVQMQASEFLNNAFSTSGTNWRGRTESYLGPDGKPLCATDHPYSPDNDVDVQSNLGNKELSIDSWDETAVAMQEWVDDRGNPLNVIPDTIIVAPYNARMAFKIAGLPDPGANFKYEPGSNNFDSNMYMGNVKVIVDWFIHPSNRKNWFAADSTRMKRFNKWQWRRKVEKGSIVDFNSEVASFKAIGRWAKGFTNYSFIYGHKV